MKVKKLTLLGFGILFTSLSFGQIKFENGYFIDNQGNKIQCLIKNIDWKNNPTEFEYKLSESDSVKTATTQTVKEFGVENYSKYIRALAQIDTSLQSIDLLERNANPEYKEIETFLKILLEGKATLYLYEMGNLRKYFLSIDHQKPFPLIHKIYLYGERSIGENTAYQQQLWNNLQSKSISLSDVERTVYTDAGLKRLIYKYNLENGSPSISYNLQKRPSFHLSIRPRINQTSLDISNSGSGGSALNSQFGNKINFSAGIEGEYILPYYKNKLSIPMEVVFQYFKSTSTTQMGSSSVNYVSIEIPVGLRYSLFLNDDSKLFFDGTYVFDLIMKNSKIVVRPSPDLQIETHGNLGLGIGYQFKNLSAELRYHTKRNVLTNYTYWGSIFNSVSLIFGLRLF